MSQSPPPKPPSQLLKDEVTEAINKMTTVASELGLKIMSDEELKEFLSKIETGWERGPYSRDEFKSKKF